MKRAPLGLIVVLDLARIVMDSLGAVTALFGVDLFRELSKTNDGNIFFSPLSITTAIGMLPLGARGSTATQLLKVEWASMAFQVQSVSRGGPRASP